MKKENIKVPAGGTIKTGKKPKPVKHTKPVQSVKPVQPVKAKHGRTENKKSLKIRFLGGVGEIGQNFRHGEFGQFGTTTANGHECGKQEKACK